MHSWGSQHGQLAPSAWESFITVALNQEPSPGWEPPYFLLLVLRSWNHLNGFSVCCGATSSFIAAALNQLERHAYQSKFFPPNVHISHQGQLAGFITAAQPGALTWTSSMWHRQCDTDHIVASFFLSSELPYWRGTARSLFNLTLLLLLICPILPTHFPQISLSRELLWFCSTKTPGPRAFSTWELH